MYGISLESKDDIKCKGINKEVVKKTIGMDHMREVLFSKKQQMREMGRIRSYGHNLFSQRVNKIALSADDDKRYILPSGSRHFCSWSL